MAKSLVEAFLAKARRLRMRAVTLTDAGEYQSLIDLAIGYEIEADCEAEKAKETRARRAG